MAGLIKPGMMNLGCVCKLLFNPTVEKADERGFILIGVRDYVCGRATSAHRSIWLIRPLTTAD